MVFEEGSESTRSLIGDHGNFFFFGCLSFSVTRTCGHNRIASFGSLGVFSSFQVCVAKGGREKNLL